MENNINITESYDHTAEFSPEDVKDNKIFAVCAYLFSFFGIVIALLGGKDSAFTRFHVKQALKFALLEVATICVGLVLCWTFIVPFAAIGFISFIGVLEIIAVVQVCCGKSEEAIILRKIKFI